MDIWDYIMLWRLGRRRLRSAHSYRELQAFQATLLLEYLQGLGVQIEHKQVVDLGCGLGGYSLEMAKRGAEVISIDLITPPYPLRPGHTALIANALQIPLSDGSAEFILCASLIEHVNDPACLLTEIERVLCQGGHCYLSFPPFYSPRGGHEFSPFHYLGDRWAMRLKGRRERHPEWVTDIFQATPDPQSLAESFQGWGLYKMTIAKAKRLISATQLETVDMSTRYLPVSMIRWPVLGEIMTWHAQFLLQKP